MWIYRHFKNTNLKISLKTNNFPERNQILTKTTCTKWKPMTGKWCKPVLIAARILLLLPFKKYNNNNNNNNNNNKLQLVSHPVAVVILHVNKT